MVNSSSSQQVDQQSCHQLGQQVGEQSFHQLVQQSLWSTSRPTVMSSTRSKAHLDNSPFNNTLGERSINEHQV